MENDAPRSGTVQKIDNFAFGGKVDFLSKRNWFLKIFLLDSSGGYFVNYINDLSKINDLLKWREWN